MVCLYMEPTCLCKVVGVVNTEEKHALIQTKLLWVILPRSIKQQKKMLDCTKKFFCIRSHQSSHAFKKSPFFSEKNASPWECPNAVKFRTGALIWCLWRLIYVTWTFVTIILHTIMILKIPMKVNNANQPLIEQQYLLVKCFPVGQKIIVLLFSLPLWHHTHTQNVKSLIGSFSHYLVLISHFFSMEYLKNTLKQTKIKNTVV